MFRSSLAAFALIWALPLPAVQAQVPDDRVSFADADMAAAEEAVWRGEMLFAYDQALHHIGLALQEDAGQLPASDIAGSFILPDDAGLRVHYFGVDETGPYLIFSAVWTGEAVSGKIIYDRQIRERLTAGERRFVTARRLVGEYEGGISLCTRGRPGIIILPRRTEADAESVYVMTPPVEDKYLLGGHTRFDIRDDIIIADRSMSNQCTVMDLATMPADGSGVFAVEHVADPVFNEIHVFTALSTDRSIAVLTRNGSSAWLLRPQNGRVEVSPVDPERLVPAQ